MIIHSGSPIVLDNHFIRTRLLTPESCRMSISPLWIHFSRNANPGFLKVSTDRLVLIYDLQSPV